ncbi:hypothetical protein GDO81_011887 [Engystomops pustulosus]|uniref:Uncharacterized protein n=1 Tax=Engystomops pustulosus TaxID=76066 RepID=A0AAV7BHR4_ENGPU|nr:hypothetical protein GDO81_011887 [Engystomops pustulosus]
MLKECLYKLIGMDQPNHIHYVILSTGSKSCTAISCPALGIAFIFLFTCSVLIFKIVLLIFSIYTSSLYNNKQDIYHQDEEL